MATEEPKKELTWQEKMNEGLPLNQLEETKAEADFNVRRHLREQKERAEFEARKQGRLGRPLAQSSQPNTQKGGE